MLAIVTSFSKTRTDSTHVLYLSYHLHARHCMIYKIQEPIITWHVFNCICGHMVEISSPSHCVRKRESRPV